jgi:hypothetical protein
MIQGMAGTKARVSFRPIEHDVRLKQVDFNRQLSRAQGVAYITGCGGSFDQRGLPGMTVTRRKGGSTWSFVSRRGLSPVIVTGKKEVGN